ncbi:unnamed protein product, partial [Amoebophrya sp. A25]
MNTIGKPVGSFGSIMGLLLKDDLSTRDSVGKVHLGEMGVAFLQECGDWKRPAAISGTADVAICLNHLTCIPDVDKDEHNLLNNSSRSLMIDFPRYEAAVWELRKSLMKT